MVLVGHLGVGQVPQALAGAVLAAHHQVDVAPGDARRDFVPNAVNLADTVFRELRCTRRVATFEGIVIDDALQLLGGRGVVRGEAVERLYREIRALRIYEGTSEIQKLIIAGQVLKD